MDLQDVVPASRLSSLAATLDLFRPQGMLDHAIILIDAAGLIRGWNEVAAALFAWPPDAIIGADYGKLFTEEDRSAGVPQHELMQAEQHGCVDEIRWHVRRDGSRFWATGIVLACLSGEARCFVKVIRNRNDLKQAQELLSRSEAQLRLLAETIPQLVWRSRSDGDWDWASPQWALFTGQTQAASLRRGWLEMIHPADRDETEEAWHVATRAAQEFVVEHRLRRADGSYCWFKTRAVPVHGADGDQEIMHWFGTSTDIGEIRESQAHVLFLAQHDTLTGAANRALLRDTLESEVRIGRVGRVLGVLCLDLDRFKICNDRVGHRGGDLILRESASRLAACLRPGDLLARIGGDEFVLLHEEDEAAGIAAFADRVVASLALPFRVEMHELLLGASIGIAVSPLDGDDPDELLRRADVALYRAKRLGGNRACRYETAMDEEVRERRLLIGRLEQAIARDGLHLHYQPFFDIVGGTLLGFEALVRWTDPERGEIPPRLFIPLAETSGLIVPLGSWVLEQACLAAAAWSTRCAVAVNLSPAQFRSGHLISQIERTLSRTGLAPDRLELEVTESLLIEDIDQVLESLRAIKRLGVRVALDDFGTGYSSLSYLRRFPFDKVKIDRSFIHAMAEDEASRSIVDAIISLGHSLRLRVTAEGIETERQLAMLRAGGCDEAQGFLLGRPAAADAFGLLGSRGAEGASQGLRP